MHNVALFGASGYTGLELAKLLAGHPNVRLACAASDTYAGRRLDEMTGRSHGGLAFVTLDAARANAADCALALLAVPADAARELAPAIRAHGTKVVDLSDAHRASSDAVYGLTSLFATDIASAPLVANPGCYATAIISAAAPLGRQRLHGDLVVNAGSGVTGAGRRSDEEMSLGEMYGEVRAYKVLRHQHVPEIEATLARIGTPVRVILTTHLLPIARGIFATLTARLARPMTSEGLTELYRQEYAGDPTIRIARTAEEVSIRRVVGTNTCLIGAACDDRGTAIVTVAIDNLLKGAAGQAVENMNLMLGLSRLAGLEHLARHA